MNVRPPAPQVPYGGLWDRLDWLADWLDKQNPGWLSYLLEGAVVSVKIER